MVYGLGDGYGCYYYFVRYNFFIGSSSIHFLLTRSISSTRSYFCACLLIHVHVDTCAFACTLPVVGGSRDTGKGLEIRSEPSGPVPLVRACDGNEPDSGRGVWSVRLPEARLPGCVHGGVVIVRLFLLTIR